MATYNKRGYRKASIENRKNALKQLNNFSNILQNMEILNKEIENYNGVITEDKLNSIAHLINMEKKLHLTDEQINIVTKKYM